MSQEYTEDKEVTLTKLSSGRRLLEALLILVALFAVWLMAALLSFNPSDPSWSQTAWHEPIHNLGGAPGAWLADTLFFIFGVMAYTIPVMIVGGCWFAWRHRANEDYIDYFAVSLRLIGVLALILTSCGLAAINADDIWYFASGGVIGSLLSTTMMPLLHSSGGTIALLCVWAAGLTLFTGWSWVSIAEKIGSVLLNILTFASNRTRRDDTWVNDEEYDDEEYDDEQEYDEPAAQRRESRRTRIMRGVLARRKRVAEKFANPLGRKTDAALFSGRRMDDEEEVQYSARGVAADPNDVLFSGHRATQSEQYDEYDPLLNGPSIAEPPPRWQPPMPRRTLRHRSRLCLHHRLHRRRLSRPQRPSLSMHLKHSGSLPLQSRSNTMFRQCRRRIPPRCTSLTLRRSRSRSGLLSPSGSKSLSPLRPHRCRSLLWQRRSQNQRKRLSILVRHSTILKRLRSDVPANVSSLLPGTSRYLNPLRQSHLFRHPPRL